MSYLPDNQDLAWKFYIFDPENESGLIQQITTSIRENICFTGCPKNLNNYFPRNLWLNFQFTGSKGTYSNQGLQWHKSFRFFLGHPLIQNYFLYCHEIHLEYSYFCLTSSQEQILWSICIRVGGKKKNVKNVLGTWDPLEIHKNKCDQLSLSSTVLYNKSFTVFLRGGIIIKKTGKFWSFSKKGLTPPPPLSDILDFLNFRLIWKCWPPLPLRSILNIFEFENILMAEDPPGLTS